MKVGRQPALLCGSPTCHVFLPTTISTSIFRTFLPSLTIYTSTPHLISYLRPSFSSSPSKRLHALQRHNDECYGSRLSYFLDYRSSMHLHHHTLLLNSCQTGGRERLISRNSRASPHSVVGRSESSPLSSHSMSFFPPLRLRRSERDVFFFVFCFLSRQGAGTEIPFLPRLLHSTHIEICTCYPPQRR